MEKRKDRQHEVDPAFKTEPDVKNLICSFH